MPRIDVLFNLAATSAFNWLEDITDEEWDRARLRLGNAAMITGTAAFIDATPVYAPV